MKTYEYEMRCMSNGEWNAMLERRLRGGWRMVHAKVSSVPPASAQGVLGYAVWTQDAKGLYDLEVEAAKRKEFEEDAAAAQAFEDFERRSITKRSLVYPRGGAKRATLHQIVTEFLKWDGGEGAAYDAHKFRILRERLKEMVNVPEPAQYSIDHGPDGEAIDPDPVLSCECSACRYLRYQSRVRHAAAGEAHMTPATPDGREPDESDLPAAHPHIRNWNPRTTNPEPKTVAPERTPVQYAIEHGGYLADAVDAYLEERNNFDAFDSPDVGDQDSLNDHTRALRDRVFEFRKRARVAAQEKP